MVHIKLAVSLICVVVLVRETAAQDAKLCRFLNPNMANFTHLQDRVLWNQMAGFWCYYYTGKYRLNFKYDFREFQSGENRIYVTFINKTHHFLYDYLNETSVAFIRASYLNDVYFEKWMTCSREAAACCDDLMTDENIYPSGEYPCPAGWDSWTCFAPAKADTLSQVLCPVITFSSQSRACELTSERSCLSSGRWAASTNYETCAIAPVLLKRHNFHIDVLAASSALALPAVIIFFLFRTFRQKMLFILHRNLIMVIIIRNLLSIMTKKILILDELISESYTTVMSENSVACRVLAFFESVAKNGIFVCMFLDGFYLHKTIVRPFANEPKISLMYVAMLVLSLVPSLIWALLRGIHDGQSCWMVDTSNDQWVSDGFRFAILGINTLLLLDIIRVMIMKLKNGTVSKQARTTLRVTLFLIPLFGVHIIIISNRDIIPDNTCAAQDVYYIISYLIEALQGIIVAILFCYTNSDVHRELKNAVRKFVIYVQQRFEFSFISQDFSKRRPTTATYVESISEPTS